MPPSYFTEEQVTRVSLGHTRPEHGKTRVRSHRYPDGEQGAQHIWGALLVLPRPLGQPYKPAPQKRPHWGKPLPTCLSGHYSARKINRVRSWFFLLPSITLFRTYFMLFPCENLYFPLEETQHTYPYELEDTRDQTTCQVHLLPTCTRTWSA